MAARGSPATKKPKCDPADLTRIPDAELAAQIEALDAEQRVADAAFRKLPLPARPQYVSFRARSAAAATTMAVSTDMSILLALSYLCLRERQAPIDDNPGKSEVFYTAARDRFPHQLAAISQWGDTSRHDLAYPGVSRRAKLRLAG